MAQLSHASAHFLQSSIHNFKSFSVISVLQTLKGLRGHNDLSATPIDV
jgi:hypothetical protein